MLKWCGIGCVDCFASFALVPTWGTYLHVSTRISANTNSLPATLNKKNMCSCCSATAKKKLDRYAPIPFTKPPIEILNLQLLETPTSKPNPRRSPSNLLTPTVVIRYEFGGLLLVHLNYIYIYMYCK